MKNTNMNFVNCCCTTSRYPISPNVYDLGFKKFKHPGGFVYVRPDGYVDRVYIKKVLYNAPATVVFWSDDTRTVAKVHGNDEFNPETGLLVCVMKKLAGSGNVHDMLKYFITEESYVGNGNVVTTADVRAKRKADGSV